MTSKFQLSGTLSVSPQTGGLLASGRASWQAPINQVMTLALTNGPDTYHFVDDDVVPVDLGSLTAVHVLTVFADRKLRVRLTSADGAQQTIPVDGMITLVSKTVPFTAIDLMRVPGQETRAEVFVGQKS